MYSVYQCMILVFTVPILTMKVTDERRQKTDQLIGTVSVGKMVVGKF